MGTGTKTGALPNLIVIGMPKCGTSALHYFLDLHPEISMSHPKELNFFIDGFDLDGHVSISSPCELEEIETTPSNWSRGLDWYTGQFDPGTPIRGESSPRYAAPWFRDVPERMASVVPDAKLIVMVRDPLERAMSHHRHLQNEHRDPRDVAEALAAPNGLYLVQSQYYRQLEPFLERFPRSSFLVVAQEDLRRRAAETMRSVYRFLGVDDGFSSPKLNRQRHRTEGKGARYRAAMRLKKLPGSQLMYRLPEEVKWGVEVLVTGRGSGEEARPALDEGLRASLVGRLEPDADRLRKFIGREFAEWNV